MRGYESNTEEFVASNTISDPIPWIIFGVFDGRLSRRLLSLQADKS